MASGISAIFNDSFAALTPDKPGFLRSTAYRALHVNLRDTSGIPFGTNTNPVFVSGSGGGSFTPGFSTLSPGYPTQVPVGAASTLLIPANPMRLYAHFTNNSGETIFIELGAAAVVGQGIRLCSGSYFTLSGFDLWLGTVYAVSTAGTVNINVTEATL